MSRLIYARDYAKIKEVYSDHDIPADLGVVIGAITESQKLIDHALELEQRDMAEDVFSSFPKM